MEHSDGFGVMLCGIVMPEYEFLRHKINYSVGGIVHFSETICRTSINGTYCTVVP